MVTFAGAWVGESFGFCGDRGDDEVDRGCWGDFLGEDGVGGAGLGEVDGRELEAWLPGDDNCWFTFAFPEKFLWPEGNGI